MIDSVLNLLFRCRHRRMTRPVTPVSRKGEPEGDTYVVCLDCGKQFLYDLDKMRVGKAIPRDSPTGVIPPVPPRGKTGKMRLALWASLLPLGWVVARGALDDRKKSPLAGPRGRRQ